MYCKGISEMISDERRCIFVHIPKTGGTSVEDAIWGADWSKRTPQQLWMGLVRPGFNKYQSGGLQHLLARQICEEVGADRFESFYKFSFVRNPWDKAVSQFHYMKTRPDLRMLMGVRPWTTFRKYLRILRKHHNRHVQSYEQWRFVCREDGELMVDFLGRFESLEEDFRKVASAIGLDDVTLPHSMKTKKRRPYTEYYDRGSADIIAEIYARDIELLDYRFNG